MADKHGAQQKAPAKRVKKEYDNDSIQVLRVRERVRKRPAVIFGSDEIEEVNTQYLKSFPLH